jgi:5-methylcytosine-specific restriction endonuclease McrA
MYNKEAKARYRKRHRERALAADRKHSRKYRAANPEKVKASKKAWHAKNRETILPKMRAYYSTNKERLLAASRKYRSVWKKNNPHKVAEHNHLRRVRRHGNGNQNCDQKIKLLGLERFCHWCCDKLTKLNFTIDHVIPISRGGAHIPDNLVACCAYCNSSRGSKLISEWTWKSV